MKEKKHVIAQIFKKKIAFDKIQIPCMVKLLTN